MEDKGCGVAEHLPGKDVTQSSLEDRTSAK